MDQSPKVVPDQVSDRVEERSSKARAAWNKLIPVHWVGETLAPAYVFVLMIMGATLLLMLETPDYPTGYWYVGVRGDFGDPSTVRVSSGDAVEGVQVGDRVLSVDGEPVTAWRQPYRRASRDPDTPATWELERPDGTRYSASLSAKKSIPISLAPGLCWLLAAVLVAWVWPKGGGVFGYFFFCVSLSVAVIGAARTSLAADMSASAFQLSRSIMLGGIPSGLALMSLSLPYPVAFLRKRPAWSYAILLACAAVPMVFAGTQYEALAWDSMIGSSILLSIGIPLVRLRAPRSRTSKSQLRAMLLFPLFATFPAMVAFRFPILLASVRLPQV